MNTIIKSLVAICTLTIGVCHADESAMRQTLATKYPATQIKSVEKSAIPGVYQVVMGKNIAYVSEDGRYFMFGTLYDMQTQTDLSANKREIASKIDVGNIPLENAIKTIKGKGTRKLIVFTDPDCPYCKMLAKTLDTMEDITLYSIIYPIAGLHADAISKSENIFCSPNNGKALDDWLVRGVPIKSQKACKNPIAENIAIATRLGLNGTPMVISMDGRLMPGAGTKEKIEEFLVTR